jgi:quinol monooxygenase YgiN
LLEQAEKEPGALLYAVHRSKDDSHVFWTTEVYADEDAFTAHAASEVQAAASRRAVAHASSSGRKALALPTNPRIRLIELRST